MAIRSCANEKNCLGTEGTEPITVADDPVDGLRFADACLFFGLCMVRPLSSTGV